MEATQQKQTLGLYQHEVLRLHIYIETTLSRPRKENKGTWPAAEAQTCEDNEVSRALESETDEELSNEEDTTLFLFQQSNDTTLNLNVSLNQSGLDRYLTSTNQIAVQTDDCNVDQPKIRSSWNCTDKIKATCAHNVSKV